MDLGDADPARLEACKERVTAQVKDAVAFATASPPPGASLAKELEYPDLPDTDYNERAPPAAAEETRTTSSIVLESYPGDIVLIDTK